MVWQGTGRDRDWMEWSRMRWYGREREGIGTGWNGIG